MSQPQEAVLDARWLRTGIGRYILTLLQELKRKIPQMRLTCITLPEHVAAVAPHCDRVIPLACGIYTLSEQLRLPLIRRGASVFCSPHYNVPVLRSGSLVVTVHDITHLLFPDYGRRIRSLFYAEPMLRIACERASRIITPSNYTRQMLIERLHAEPEKISVIPCAVDEVFQLQDKKEATESVRQAHGIDEPYMLYVGSAAPHKNLGGLLEAHHRLRSRKPETPALVLVLSDSPRSPQLDNSLRSLKERGEIYCLSSVSDAALAALYSAACMTVLPSFEEGFGLPVVESMACGTPVLCSKTASLPEIAGDAAMYFDPGSSDDIADKMEGLLDSTTTREDLTAAGLKRAAMYSVGRAAASYASVLSSVIELQG